MPRREPKRTQARKRFIPKVDLRRVGFGAAYQDLLDAGIVKPDKPQRRRADGRT